MPFTIDQLNQKYAGAKFNPPLPPPPQGAIKSVIKNPVQAGNNFVNNFSSHIASFGEGVLSPVAKGIASAGRAVQSTPDLLGAIGNYTVGNKAAGDEGIAAVDRNLAQPVNLGFNKGKSDTLGSSTPAQNLGTAAQAASFLVPATGLGAIGGGAVAGALQGGGAAAEDKNATAGGIAASTALGAGAGATIGAATKFLPDWFSSLSSGKGEAPAASSASDLLDTATKARSAAGGKAVDAYNSMVENVSGFKSALGENFANEANKLTQGQPELKLNLSNSQMEALNSLKESKSFSLPSYLSKDNNPLLAAGVSPDFMAKNAGALANMQNATQVSLTPSEAQDLITQLNKTTFNAKASGQLAVNQQTIGVTNDIKQAAQEAFGDKWTKIYSDYAQGVTAVQKLDDIVNIDKNATPTDINKSLDSILKLSKTPEGKVILQQAIQDYKNVSGFDLSNPVQTIHQIIDKQIELEEAKGVADEAAKKAAKGGFFKRLIKAGESPEMIARRVVGGAITVGVLYPALRAIQKAIAEGAK